MANQARLDELQRKVDDGSITPEEKQEYDRLKAEPQDAPSDQTNPSVTK